MFSSLSAIRRRPWAASSLLIGLLVGLSVALVAPAAATDDGEPVISGDQIEEVIPDAIVQLGESPEFRAQFDVLIADLAALTGVAWTADDLTADPRPRILVGFDDGAERVALRAIDSYVADRENGEAITVGGRAIVDRSIAEHVSRALRLVVILAAFSAGALGAWLLRPRHGVTLGLMVLATGWMSSIMSSALIGDFDGSVVTTPVAAVLAGIVVTVTICFRLFFWFTDPTGDDLAEMIRRSVYHLGVELGLFFGSLVVVAVVLELLEPGRSIATVVLIGALTSTLVTLAVVPPVLAAMHGAGSTATGEQAGPVAVTSFLATRPNGREFPLAVLAAFGCFFVFVGLLSVGTATVPAPLERSGTAAAVESGDPTDSMLVRFAPGSDQQEKTSWLTGVSQLPSVGRVDTSVSRFVSGQEVLVEGAPLGAFAASIDNDEAPGFALIVPTVTARSRAAAELVQAVRSSAGSLDTSLAGTPVEAVRAGERDRSVVWTSIIVLTIVTAFAMYGLVGDLTISAIVGGLRLFDSMAVVGLYHLIADRVSGPELLLAVFVVAVGASLFEFGFVRRLLLDHQSADTEELIVSALSREGLAAAMAIAAVGVGTLGFVGGIGPFTRLGIVMIVLMAVEIVVGFWLLRPAVLGRAAILHFASQPVRRALDRLGGSGANDAQDFSRWVGLVTSLLHQEFRLQAEPATAPVETVFVDDTPALDRAIEHHQKLAGAGLRVIGRNPELRTLQVVAPGPPAAVAITVDHPVRHLVNDSGKIVGLRKAERRTAMLWLDDSEGHYRIADLVELGSVPLEIIEQPAPALAPSPHLSLE